MFELSIVLGALLPIAVAIAGLLLLRRAMLSPKDFVGRPLADFVAGMALLAFATLVCFMSNSETGSDRRDSMRTACLSNLVHTGRALLLYASDNDNCLPPREEWCDLSKPYFTSTPAFSCPEMRDEPFAFMLNQHFGARHIAPPALDEYKVLCFDGTGGKNLYGGIDSVQYRHKGRTTLFFLDGHGKPAYDNEVGGYLWRDTHKID